MIPPVIVTGCPRSGTSMTAGILAMCGAFVGTVGGKRGDPRLSSFENVEVKHTVLSPYMELNKADPSCQWPLPDINNLVPAGTLASRIESIIKFQGCGNGVWMLKSSCYILLWPEIIKVFPEAKWVVVQRRLDHVVHSCRSTGYMRAFHTPQGWAKWAGVYMERVEGLQRATGATARVVWPSDFVDGDFTDIRGVVEWVGLGWDEEKVREFVCPQRWRK